MQQCLIYDRSLKFSRIIYGLLALLAFFLRNPWLVLILGTLMILEVFSVKYNLLYHLHFFILRKLLGDKSEPIKRELGELAFTCSVSGTFLFVGFLFSYFGKFVDFAWILVLIVSFLMLLASFTGVCVASIMYAVFKKIFKR
ncbi:DUF4395 domain-containing protein [Patescibacteria group bacterium]|nr:DUF4395 domain-containing protein [Patescibacteria group bacterium]MBU4274418.1 DUF4395 domain-containing protein [Patescibacteria group bacterium]MBU4368002.1 DUF4395 domain-containing protein [Patescibacteria group bacterium]MBU4462237.1 DUF4395 domain-containing protein [Patescibacteria group bacterium]MCG2699593.1 DUF4395 domain-containing protein [Candidatus Parcubacteria bacterium]